MFNVYGTSTHFKQGDVQHILPNTEFTKKVKIPRCCKLRNRLLTFEVRENQASWPEGNLTIVWSDPGTPFYEGLEWARSMHL